MVNEKVENVENKRTEIRKEVRKVKSQSRTIIYRERRENEKKKEAETSGESAILIFRTYFCTTTTIACLPQQINYFKY